MKKSFLLLLVTLICFSISLFTSGCAADDPNRELKVLIKGLLEAEKNDTVKEYAQEHKFIIYVHDPQNVPGTKPYDGITKEPVIENMTKTYEAEVIVLAKKGRKQEALEAVKRYDELMKRYDKLPDSFGARTIYARIDIHNLLPLLEEDNIDTLYLSWGVFDELIVADKEGEAEAYAQTEEARDNGIRLVDGKLGLMVAPKPGQVNAAIKAVENLGGTVTAVEKITGILSTYVPIQNIIPLQETECIHAVDLPAVSHSYE